MLFHIQDYALERDWYVAFGGMSRGNRHLFRVVTIARFLSQKEQARGDICEAGAWLHDSYLALGNDDDPQRIRAEADAYLAGLALDEDSRRRIAECVEAHEGVGAAASLEAKIVHDADALDKMGLLGVIRHTWKMVNLIAREATASDIFFRLQAHLRMREKRLYTATAKQLVWVINRELPHFFAHRERAIAIIDLIMQRARLALTSDEIATELLCQTDQWGLLSQLEISQPILEGWYAQSARSASRDESQLAHASSSASGSVAQSGGMMIP
jgi:HD superfamily phosphodiesterase